MIKVFPQSQKVNKSFEKNKFMLSTDPLWNNVGYLIVGICGLKVRI